MYLDPGFGSMLIQVLVASLVAAGAMLGIFRHKVIAFFSKKKNNTQKNSSEEENTYDE